MAHIDRLIQISWYAIPSSGEYRKDKITVNIEQPMAFLSGIFTMIQ